MKPYNVTMDWPVYSNATAFISMYYYFFINEDHKNSGEIRGYSKHLISIVVNFHTEVQDEAYSMMNDALHHIQYMTFEELCDGISYNGMEIKLPNLFNYSKKLTDKIFPELNLISNLGRHHGQHTAEI